MARFKPGDRVQMDPAKLPQYTRPRAQGFWRGRQGTVAYLGAKGSIKVLWDGANVAKSIAPFWLENLTGGDWGLEPATSG